MGTQNAVNGIGKVLRLEISKLALLTGQLHIEQVVVDLCDERLQRNAVLDAGRADQRSDNVTWIHKTRSSRRRGNCSLLKIAGRMASSRNLLDALTKDPTATNKVQNLCLIQRNFNRARSNVVCCAMNIGKLRVHLSPFQNKKGAAAATPI